jgi:3-methyladenine DNA glycosylase AlkC
VANNLNDIGKDHPELLADIAKKWLEEASKDREWLVKMLCVVPLSVVSKAHWKH